jgi:choline dehydrogenase-like flavoprotein
MISMRGQAADYDHWRQLGLTGWGYDDVLPLFRRLEDHFLGESEHHGAGGGWRIEAPRLSWDILDAVGDAAEEMGIKRIADFNTGDNEGTSYFHVNQKRGRRWSSARGFLKPVLNRGNLRLEKNVLVDRLIVEKAAPSAYASCKVARWSRPAPRAKSFYAPDRSDRRRCCTGPASGPPTGCRRSASMSCSTDRASGAICRTICSSARSTRFLASAR